MRIKMNFEKRITVSLSAIEKMMEEGSYLEAYRSIRRLSKVMGRLGRNNEAIECGYLHTKETLESAKTENRIILSSHLNFHEIKLAK